MQVIDGTDCVLGRLAAHVAKELLKGEKIVIVNAEKIVIIGRPDDIIAKYKQRIGLRDIAKPVKSPKYPKRPDLFVKRTIRGMIPYRTRKGRNIYRNVVAYMGVPKEFDGKGVKVAEMKSANVKYMTVEKVCKKLGWRC